MNQFNIDPDFSVYSLTKRSMQNATLLSHRRTMSIISNEIENATIIDHADNVIFSSFQRMSKFLPQVERYRQIASTAKHAYVFGIVDCELPAIDNVTYVPLQPSDQLAKEWFLVSFGRDYFSALATEELSNIDEADEARKFKGVWSFDVFLVGILHEWLSGIVGLRSIQQESEKHDYQRHADVLSNTIGRMTVRLMDHEGDNDVVYSELQTIMTKTLHPAYNALKEHPQVDKVDPLQQNLRIKGSA